MLISGRHACIHLEGAGVGNRQARQLLTSGLAGPRVETAWAHFYESDDVLALTRRPRLDLVALRAAFPHGLLISRRVIDLDEPEHERRLALSAGWRFAPLYRGWIAARLDAHGPLPLVATIAGFVVLCADVVGTTGDCGSTTLRLTTAGPWAEHVAGSRIPLGPGREWALLGFPWSDRSVS